MLFRTVLAAFVTIAILSGPAPAGDAAARKVLGFSPDGRYFAVEQYSMLYEDEAAFSDYIVVDTTTDRLVAGAPKILVRGDDGLDEKAARRKAAEVAQPLLTRLGIGAPGTRVAGAPSMSLDDIGIFQTRTDPLATALTVPLTDGRRAALALTTRPLGTVICAGLGGRATPGRAKAQGLVLTMAIDREKPVVLQRDERLPNSRRCAAGYGIAEAWTHTANDTIALAVLIEVVDNEDWHAGPNRRFMVVTRRIAR